jgi:endonuclease YncB( thermonuclease family)
VRIRPNLSGAAWIFALLISSAALSADLSGPVRVIDGDTLDMTGVRIRLWGIDAPEKNQTCQGKDGQIYECGRDSAAVMLELTRDRRVECENRGRDRYKRIVAVCQTEAGEINAAIVRRGWAVDWPRYSNSRYQDEERAARAEGLGIWSGRFEMPWDWRQEHRRKDGPRSRIEQ